MDFSQLRALCASVDAGSLTEAARRLGMSQPGLSRQVQRLEEEVGARLLARQPSGVRPTPAGERLVEFARRTLAAFEAVRAEVRESGPPLSGSLAIAASTTPGEYVVPTLVSAFIDLHTNVSADVQVTDSQEVGGLLLEGHADVGFTGHRAEEPQLAHIPIARDEIVLALPAGHPLSGTEVVRPEQLAGERLIQREPGSGTQRTFFEALQARGTRLPVHLSSVTFGSTQAVLSAVEASLGVGLVTRRALEHHRPSTVVAARVAGPPVVRHLFLVYEPARRHPVHVDAFIRFVVDTAGEELRLQDSAAGDPPGSAATLSPPPA